jgi:glycosyltransferase involved in cell wall biosynthesis
MIAEPNRVRVLYVEQFYFPEGWGGAQLPRDITTDLSRHGYAVCVLCGSEQYAPLPDDSVADPRESGVEIRRVPKFLAGDIHSRKLLRQLWFYAFAAPMVIFAPRPSVFITQTNPPLIVAVLAGAAWILRRPLVIIAQDVYPEVMVAHGMLRKGGWPEKILSSLFRWTYRRAAGVVSLGPVMTRRLIAKGVDPAKVHEISNWATGDASVVRGAENRLRADWGLQGKFVILYSGNLGVAHDAETIVRGVAAARSSISELRLVFIGRGGGIDAVRGLVHELGVEDAVVFQDFFTISLLPHSLGLADLALVSLLERFTGLVVPSKLLGHMARGIPTLYIGPRDSDAADLIDRSGGGIVIRNGDVESFVAKVGELARDASRLQKMGDSAAQYYNRHLSREMGLARYRRLIDTIVKRP